MTIIPAQATTSPTAPRWLPFTFDLAQHAAVAWCDFADLGLAEPLLTVAGELYADLLRDRIEALPGVVSWLPAAGLLGIHPDADPDDVSWTVTLALAAAEDLAADDHVAIKAALLGGAGSAVTR
jgi:hypothetical protein